MKKLLLLSVLSFSLLTFSFHVKAQFTDLLNFNGTNGSYPYGNLLCYHDSLFGVTAGGGLYNGGTIFSVKPDGTGYNDLYDFGPGDLSPFGSLVRKGTTLYGIASYGGVYGFGGIFSISTNGSGYSEMHDFNGVDGAYGYGSLTLSLTQDSLFGMTCYGGIYSYGNIFYIGTNTSSFTDLYDFSNFDGSSPYGSLTLCPSGKSLVGMANTGGNSGYGDIFIINTDGSDFYDMHDFTGGYDGAYPNGDLVFSCTSDSAYGLCPAGGNSGYGNLFTIAIGSGLTDLFDFGGESGLAPQGNVTVAGNTLYGLTNVGGVYGNGNLFSIRTNGTHFVDMMDFTGANGSQPNGSVVFDSNVIYGMTTAGGAYGIGVVFSDTTLNISHLTITNVTCTKSDGGSAEATVVGGVTPYTYYWIPGGATTQGIEGLTLGSYTVIVADNRGSTASAVAVVAGVSLSLSVLHHVSCYGENNGQVTITRTGGTAPFTYTVAGGGTYVNGKLPAGAYTLTVTDECGATATATATITQPGPVPTPTIVALGTDSVLFKIEEPDTALSYSWTLKDFATTYSGMGDTIFLPVYPRNGTLYYYATNNITSCFAVDSMRIFHYIDSTYTPPSNLPYPRWSERGVWLESANHYYTPVNGGDSIRMNGTPFVTWCRNNHITYVILDGVDNDDPNSSCGVFSIDNSNYDTTNAVYLENFIDSLKTRGGVKQIGIECWPSDLSNNEDSDSYSIKVFNCANIAEGIRSHNWGLPWEKKVDILNLDEEFWGSEQYFPSLADFHTTHIPMLKAMYAAAHECGDNYIRVEDYIEEPTNPGNTSFNINDSVDIMEADSIALYSDRVLNSVYSFYHIALWNEADFRLAYPNFGNNPHKNMEIWPAFGAENYDMGLCPKFWYLSGDNFSGSNLCTLTKIDTADWIEEQYYDSAATSIQKKIFSDNVGGAYRQDSMGADTNFQILGGMWYDYRAIDTERIQFDTLTSGLHKGYLRFYITLPHDSQFDYPPVMPPRPIYVHARVHGGVPPYNYIWRDMDSNKLLQSSGSDTLEVTYSPVFPAKISVEAIDGNDSTAIDYMCIYPICQEPPLDKPVQHKKPAITSAFETGVKVYPNPASSLLNIEMLTNTNEICYFDLYDLMGQKVKNMELSNNLTIMDLSSLSSGVYFYRVTKSDGSLIKSGKVIVIH